MEFLHKPIPSYIYKKSNIISLVIFTAVFALIFINIYKPFNSKAWYPDVSEIMFFVYSSLLILVGMLVVVVSRVIMYKYGKNHSISVLSFIIWIIAEIIAMSISYTALSLAVEHTDTIVDVLKNSIKNTSLVLLLPYAISLLYFSMQEKSNQLKMIKDLQKSSDQQGPNILSFYDEKGELRLSIKKDSLLYIESADNYVCVWYLNKGKISKFLLRNTLKVMEGFFDGTNILRCHRSYIVNFDKVNIIRREKEGIFIDFGIENVPDIPVSKSYSEKVTKSFMIFPS